jgi:hypothetical protein
VTLCDTIEIELVDAKFHGNRPWAFYQWAIVDEILDAGIKQLIQGLVGDANTNQAAKITIQKNTLKKFTNIVLSLEVENFLHLRTKSQIQLSTYEYSSPTVRILQGGLIVATTR